MGKRKTQRKNATMLDSDDDNSSVSSSSTMRSDQMSVSASEEVEFNKDSLLDEAVDALYEKRGSTREKALAVIIEAFNSNLQQGQQFVERKTYGLNTWIFVLLLVICLLLAVVQVCYITASVFEFYQKGVQQRDIFGIPYHWLVSNTFANDHALMQISKHKGFRLLALTVGPGDNAREILEESMIPLSQAFKSGSDPSKTVSLLECMAVITFVGGNDSEETEKSMQIMWQLVHPKLGSNVVAVKPSAAVITAVVSAWSFLLTTMDGWRLSPKLWQESITYLSGLLDKDDRSVRIAAGEALAVIFEMGSLEKFAAETKGSSDGSVSEGNKSKEVFSYIQGLKGKILNQVRDLSVEAGGKGSAKKDLNNQRNLFKDVLEFLEDGYSPNTSMKIGGDLLQTSSWSQLIQENEFLQDIFGFTPNKRNLLASEHMSNCEKRMYKSPNSALNKARTQLLNKQRMLSAGRNFGHYAVNVGDEDS
ncbi:interferon-related developmental regulator 1-like [Gossypium australe]|uniref:Interferon-related developmental regulator 1-like n=1 Tax=Gossypium australe TaxID=47621 RepID=A0A5B6X3J1_9ROSI|nr:interferon-related developmental regulator 1-like [Gossypium australe]